MARNCNKWEGGKNCAVGTRNLSVERTFANEIVEEILFVSHVINETLKPMFRFFVLACLFSWKQNTYLNQWFIDNCELIMREEVPEIRIWSMSLIKSGLKWCKHLGKVRLGCFTPYQQLRLYNGAPFSRLLRQSGDTEDIFSA